jgi:hypothetical protein
VELLYFGQDGHNTHHDAEEQVENDEKLVNSTSSLLK